MAVAVMNLWLQPLNYYRKMYEEVWPDYIGKDVVGIIESGIA